MSGQTKQARPYDIVKRMFDVVVSLIGLALTSPLQAGIAVLVARKLHRPILFRQQRPGRAGAPFELLKFRTMIEPDEVLGLLSDEQRLTEFGAKLRRTSLDELPTLLNVLRGEMSLVGPRPLMMQYLDRYSSDQHRRHEVRPGITGLAQVGGRNLLSWDDKFRADLDYVDRRSLILDAKILFRTMSLVLRREGISADGVATMPEFFGPADDSR